MRAGGRPNVLVIYADDLGYGDGTLVVATSDNGPEQRWEMAYSRTRITGHRSMGPLRGAKRDVYEGGLLRF